MKRIAYSLLLFGALALIPQQGRAQESQAFKTAKSIDIFHSVLRELSLIYVDTLAIDQLVYKGIDAMLSSLDPYTELVPEEENESIDMLTTGSYGGIGSLIKKRPGEPILLSEPFEGSPAARASLVAGDRILQIDGQEVLDWEADACSARMKGMPGTQVHFLVHKWLTNDTVEVTVTRERVHVSDVGLCCLLQDSIAYARVTGFTQGGAAQLRKELKALKEAHPIAGMVLDLRGNGGGLMEEAVKMLSIFLPKQTLVVSAKGRDPRLDTEYYTKEEPLDLHTPLVVLVDGGSASSSEIVTGALQDLQRATIVGQRTFGKGLVQTIRPLSYNAHLRLTTAKYYIPSGRCVQAIDYSRREEGGALQKDENGGILPNIVVEEPPYNRIVLELVARDYLHEYSLDYFKKYPSIAPPQDFCLSDEDYEEFVQITAKKEFEDRSATELWLEQFERVATAEGYQEALSAELASLKQHLLTGKEADLRHYKPELKPLLEEEICNRYYFAAGRMRSLLRNDKVLDRALEVFTPLSEEEVPAQAQAQAQEQE